MRCHIDFASAWSGKRDSNSRPQPWQGCALPTELFPHAFDTKYFVFPSFRFSECKDKHYILHCKYFRDFFIQKLVFLPIFLVFARFTRGIGTLFRSFCPTLLVVCRKCRIFALSMQEWVIWRPNMLMLQPMPCTPKPTTERTRGYSQGARFGLLTFFTNLYLLYIICLYQNSKVK